MSAYYFLQAMKFGSNEAFRAYQQQQIEEREKYLTPEEREKKQKTRENNRLASRKHNAHREQIVLRIGIEKDENGFSTKEKWKLFAEEVLGTSTTQFVLNTINKTIENYEAVHGGIDFKALKEQIEERERQQIDSRVPETIEKMQNYIEYLENELKKQQNEKAETAEIKKTKTSSKDFTI